MIRKRKKWYFSKYLKSRPKSYFNRRNEKKSSVIKLNSNLKIDWLNKLFKVAKWSSSIPQRAVPTLRRAQEKDWARPPSRQARTPKKIQGDARSTTLGKIEIPDVRKYVQCRKTAQ